MNNASPNQVVNWAQWAAKLLMVHDEAWGRPSDTGEYSGSRDGRARSRDQVEKRRNGDSSSCI